MPNATWVREGSRESSAKSHKSKTTKMSPQAELTALISTRKWEEVIKHLPRIANSGESKASGSCPNPTIGLFLLHLALRFMAPLSVVSVLLDPTRGGHPLSITTPESSTGMLPLHLACQHGASPSVVDLILQRHPSAIDVKDDAGKTAMDYAKNPACPQQSKVGQVEVVAVLNRAEGYQTIAKMIQEQAGKDVCRQREQLQQAEKKMGLLRRELELELGRQEHADGSMTTLLGQLKNELHASRKDAVMKDLVASTAVGTANNLERQLAQVKEELAAEKEANSHQSIFSMFGTATKDSTAIARIRQLEATIDAKEEDKVRLTQQVTMLERMLQTTTKSIELLESQNASFQEEIVALQNEARDDEDYDGDDTSDDEDYEDDDHGVFSLLRWGR